MRKTTLVLALAALTLVSCGGGNSAPAEATVDSVAVEAPADTVAVEAPAEAVEAPAPATEEVK